MSEVDELIPPPELRFVGAGDYPSIARDLLRQIVEASGLGRRDRVLDVGCGVGRMAAALTRYLEPQAVYEGFDVVGPGVDWCRAHITPRFPNFHFQTADVCNADYNPRGCCDASAYVFPYADRSFDFVFLTSVFTHMLPAAVENYVYEISRVLRPGGRCFATFFLWNPETAALAQAGKGQFTFPHDRGVYRVQHRRRPEAVVCYDEGHVLSLLAKYGFDVNGQVYHGAWSGRPPRLGAQDVVVMTKARAALAGKPRASQLARWARGAGRSATRAMETLRYVLLGGTRHDGWRSHAEYCRQAEGLHDPPARPAWRGLVPRPLRRLARFLLKRQAG